MKKYLVAALIVISMNLMAGDIEDIKYINKLYQKLVDMHFNQKRH